MNQIQLKRVYEAPAENDGYRILVDRLWPRGVKKADLPYNLWAKNIAPSNELRKAFNHEEAKFEDFKRDYLFEMAENDEAPAFVTAVKQELDKQNVTLLYAARDPKINHVVVLKEWLEKSMDKSTL